MPAAGVASKSRSQRARPSPRSTRRERESLGPRAVRGGRVGFDDAQLGPQRPQAAAGGPTDRAQAEEDTGLPARPPAAAANAVT